MKQYNEVAYGEKIYNGGFQSKNYRYDLLILSKYLKHEKELTKEQHVEYITEFCEKYFTDYNPILCGDMIDKAIENGRKLKNKPLVIESIPIYMSEMQAIDKWDICADYKKILLTMLFDRKLSCESRIQLGEMVDDISLYFKGSPRKYGDVKKRSKIKGKYDIDIVIKELNDLGIVESKYKGDIVLKFAEGIEYGEIFYNVKEIDFDKVGLVYDYYKGDKVKECAFCGVLIKVTTSNNLYCETCKKEKQLEHQRESMKKKRQVK